MEIASKYSPSGVEDKWYDYWMKQGFFTQFPMSASPIAL